MKSIERFFEDYAQASMAADTEGIADCYADNFMITTKKLSTAFVNDAVFREWLKDMFAFNEKTGLQQMRVQGVETVPVGKYFLRATVTWAAAFSQQPEEEVFYYIHYILNMSAAEPKIVLYISEEEREEILEGKGLL